MLLNFSLMSLLVGCSDITANDGNDPSAIEKLLGVADAKAKSQHNLSRLAILSKDLALLKANYVDSADLDSKKLQEMFEAALEHVEWNVDEAYFVYVAEKNILHMTVGEASKTTNVPKFNRFEELLSAFQMIAVYLDTHLHSTTDRADVEYSLINGAFSTLDPHTLLLPPIQAAEMDLDNQGEFGGLGIQITTINGQLTVKEPIEDTPAFRAGLKADDKIVRIENSSTINMDLSEAVSLLRGEIGTAVNIMVMRKGWSKPKPFNIVRGRIRIDPVKGEMLKDGIGYVRIQAFNANVSDDLRKFLEAFNQSDGYNGLILDLRSNPGGYLDQAFKVSDMFLDSGVIVSTVEGSERTKDELLARRPNSFTDTPIVVLVNGSSASASEIVAGAIRNRNRGIIVGEVTFGKGSVQHLYSNPDGSQLKLTVAQYLTPGERSIQSVGIPPDVYLEQSTVQSVEDNPEPLISLYWREWLQREADLDRHLENEAILTGDTTYTVRYLVPPRDDGTKPKPKDDWEVQFAHKLLKAAPVPERAKQLQGIADVIDGERKLQAVEIKNAFSELDIDWSYGSIPANNSLELSLDDSSKEFTAGVEEQLTVIVKNTGDFDYHQLSLITSSNNPALDHQEFYVGKLPSGEAREVTQRVQLPYGYGDEVSEFSIEARTPEKRNLITQSLKVNTVSNASPNLTASIEIYDGNSAGARGNGNGIPEVGEIIAINLDLTNNGDGFTRDAFVRLKNKHRKSLDIIEGIIEVGTWQTDDGENCEAETEYCYRKLAPKSKMSGQFLVELRDDFDGGWSLEILMGDNRAYDYDSIVRGGFTNYFMQKRQLDLSKDEAFDSFVMAPPMIDIRTEVPLRVAKENISVSGIVSDDIGLQELMIFHNDDKIYYRSEATSTLTAPFSADIELESGLNQIHFLVKDTSGLNNTKTINIWKDE